jgi:hypothetical protein
MPPPILLSHLSTKWLWRADALSGNISVLGVLQLMSITANADHTNESL